MKNIRKYKNLILIVSFIIFLTAAALTFIIWRSLDIKDRLENSPNVQMNPNDTNGQKYNLEEKDTTWKTSGEPDDKQSDDQDDEDKDKDSKDTDKKGNGSGNDKYTDTSPAYLAPIGGGEMLDEDAVMACSNKAAKEIKVEMDKIKANTADGQDAARAAIIHTTSLEAGSETYVNYVESYKNAHGGRTPQEQLDYVTQQGTRQQQAFLNSYMTQNPTC